MTQMQSLHITNYTKPAGYQIGPLPKPTISTPHDVLIQVHAASINPIDVKVAAGTLAPMQAQKFPYQIGYDVSGAIAAIGSSVTSFKKGDEVYARLPEENRGSISEFAVTQDAYIALKPRSLTFVEAASLPLVTLTALQALQRASDVVQGGTVFVTGGLSGTGSMACQLAKNCFGAKKVITTVSTQKVDQVDKILGEGVVDQIIDYKTTNPLNQIKKGSVDYLFDTTAEGLKFMPLLKPKTGRIITISAIPSGDQIKNGIAPSLPIYLKATLNLLWSFSLCWAWWYQVKYEYMFMHPIAKDLEQVAKWAEEKKLRPVVGQTVDLNNLEAVRDACNQVYLGKGGIGKAVVKIV